MTEPETQYRPLVGAPSQQSAINEPAQSRPTRAYKIAGVTLLACVLIAGQAMIAYFLLSQGNDIKSLAEQNNNLQAQLSRGRSGSASGPVRIHMPINALSEMVDVSATEGGTSRFGSRGPCEKEVEEGVGGRVGGFRPACDGNGLYVPQQCYMGKCWCVNKASGVLIQGSTRDGPASCRGKAVMGRSGGLHSLAVAKEE